MNRRVVLREVAEKVGVHLTTAARAIKNDPRVKPETLAKVQQAAREMGYSADPMLSALSVYRTASKPSQFHGTVGWVTNFPTPNGWKHESFAYYREGAAETLARHGYRVEDFWLQQSGVSARRSTQILQSRGIRGLLVCPLPVMCGHLSLKWDRFASVTFGYSLFRPSLHLVTTSHYHNMHICLRTLRNLGHRRIGFVTWDEISKRVYQFWTAAYRTPPFSGRLLPILDLKMTPHTFSDHNKEIFLKWCETHRPDAVVAVDKHILDWLKEIYRVPEDISYVSPSLQESNVDHHAGVREPSLDIGRAAGDFLAGLLGRGQYGIPKVPQRVTLDGVWQDGPTVESKRLKSANSSPVKPLVSNGI